MPEHAETVSQIIFTLSGAFSCCSNKEWSNIPQMNLKSIEDAIDDHSIPSSWLCTETVLQFVHAYSVPSAFRKS
jgi:hypothetical protein